MYAAKIEHNAVNVHDIRTGSLKRTYGCGGYKGAVSAQITGEQVAVTCWDGRVRVFDIRTGSTPRKGWV